MCPEPTERLSALDAGVAGTAEGSTDLVTDLLDLRAALHTLAPRRRATVVLRYYCDYSVEQTAQALGCSVGTPNTCLQPNDLETARRAWVTRTRVARSAGGRREAGPGGLRLG